MNKDPGQLLFDRAAAALKLATGIRMLLGQEVTVTRTGIHNDFNQLVNLELPTSKLVGEFAVEIQRHLNRAMLATILQQKQTTDYPLLLISNYVNPKIAEDLIAHKINYIDAAGNAAIMVEDAYVYVTGNKPLKELQRKRPPTRAFRTAGLKLLLAVLMDKTLLNTPYRNIANVTGIGLGTITNVFNDLEELQFLQTVGKQRRLRNVEGLILKWADAYIERTRQKLIIGRYTTGLEGNWEGTYNLKRFGAYWGGEVATQRITKYLLPETKTIYATAPATQIKMNLRLTRDPAGNIELLEAFWPLKANLTNNDLAPALVVYADLLAIGDGRTKEAAALLYEKLLTIYCR